MNDMTALERAIRVIQLLMTHDRVTIDDLYERFHRQVSKRTLQRTIQSLEAANVPIQRDTGAHGRQYLSLQSGIDYIPQLLTPDEALAAILLSRYRENFTDTPMGHYLEQVLEKLEQLLPTEGVVANSGLVGLRDVVHQRQPGTIHSQECDPYLLRLVSAILQQRVCRITYQKLGDHPESHFEIKPYSVVFSSGAIYLIGYQDQYATWIHLALQRIRGVEISDQSFHRDPDFDLQQFLNGSFGIWQADPEPVQIRFDKLIAEYIQERIWHPTQEFAILPGGDLLMSLQVGISSELSAWILRWGAYAEVLAPASLRSRIGATLQQAAQRYES